MISILLTSIFIGWLSCVGYTIYSITFPAKCRLENNSKAFKSKCLEPHMLNGRLASAVFFTGVEGIDDTIVQMWEDREYRMGSSLSVEFVVQVPHAVRQVSAQLMGWLVLTPHDSKGNDLFDQRLVLKIELSATKKIKQSSSPVRNLLADKSSTSESLGTSIDTECQHWKYGRDSLKIRTVDFQGITLKDPFLPELMHVLDTRFVNGQLHYDPILFIDDVSMMSKSWIPFSQNISMPGPKLKLEIIPTSALVFAFKKLMLEILKVCESFLGESEINELKFWLSDEWLYRYLVSQAIIWLHIIFEFLAFRQDWAFFVGRKSFKGLSTSSMIFSVVRSAVIFLYLYDAGTSSLILFSVGKDLAYSAWKLWKVLQHRIRVTRAVGAIFPSLDFVDKLDLSEEDRRTLEYDTIATTHVGLCVYPLVVGLAAYSLVYYRYTSWFSWAVSSAADAVYFFGFIALTPQLYINYRLKSVAHLPLRAFCYKAFSTFVDDVFAFVVKMPMKHRIMCLRDDLVFLGFLYQWMVYPADKARPNEFGFQYEGAPTRETNNETQPIADAAPEAIAEVDPLLETFDVTDNTCSTNEVASGEEELNE